MKTFLVSAVIAAMAVPAMAQNAPAKVAVIDVQKVLATSTAGKTAYERLKKMQDERIAKAKGMEDELRRLETELSTKRLSLSEDKVTELSKQINDRKISMQRFAQDADREVGEARDRALLELENKIKPVIDALGKEMGLAAIFNKFESGLVYASDAIDLTDTVVQRFNAAVASNPASGTPSASNRP
ncbi:MAG TPA: OmpH family outer membrane protein [Thermoanaerobaculia bacterium]|nr:OmpH family outer membrane protein [Thermoanaerobaculia bacterium]